MRPLRAYGLPAYLLIIEDLLLKEWEMNRLPTLFPPPLGERVTQFISALIMMCIIKSLGHLFRMHTPPCLHSKVMKILEKRLDVLYMPIVIRLRNLWDLGLCFLLEAAVKIPHDTRIKQVLANGKKGTWNVGRSCSYLTRRHPSGSYPGMMEKMIGHISLRNCRPNKKNIIVIGPVPGKT